MNAILTGLNVKLLSLLLICCAVLAIIVIGEWWYANYSYQNLLTSIEDIDEEADGIETMPEIKLAEKSQESYSAMVNRPLFTEGRKPIDEADEATSVQEFTGKIELVLTGLVETPEGITAMLQDNNKKHYRAKQGEEAQGWEVTKIEADKVIVEQGSNRKELMLRKPKPVQTSPASPTITPPRRAPPRRPRTGSQPGQAVMRTKINEQL